MLWTNNTVESTNDVNNKPKDQIQYCTSGIYDPTSVHCAEELLYQSSTPLPTHTLLHARITDEVVSVASRSPTSAYNHDKYSADTNDYMHSPVITNMDVKNKRALQNTINVSTPDQ